MIAKTAQHHCCTRNGLESPDLQRANWQAGIEKFYTLLVQLGRSTIHFHSRTHNYHLIISNHLKWAPSYTLFHNVVYFEYFAIKFGTVVRSKRDTWEEEKKWICRKCTWMYNLKKEEVKTTKTYCKIFLIQARL